MTESIESALLELGFSPKEIKVYLAIVQSGSATAAELSRKTGLHRPTVYDIIEKLIGKGLIARIMGADKKTFGPSDFDKFFSIIKEQERLASLAVQELNKLRIAVKEEYKVEVFEGREGLKSYFDYVAALLKRKELKSYLVLGSNVKIIKQINFFLLSRLRDSLRLAKGVDFRVIWSQESKGDLFRKAIEKFAGKHKFLPKGSFSECTTVVFNEFVALMFDSGKPVIVRIHSRKVADTYKGQFELLWKLV